MRAYLDHASTSPLRPAARDALVAALDGLVGDPSRIHQEAMSSRVALEQARQTVADAFGCRSSREVVFTSSATEAAATAVHGAAAKAGPGSNQVHAAVEHAAVRLAAEAAGEVRIAGVDGTGRVDPDELLALVDDRTAAVHVQWANHEVGTLQPVAEVVAACRERRVLVHVDAAQAAGRVPIDFRALDADLVSISGHKLGGPAGTGILLVRRGVRLAPLLVGGDQERARRAGFENVAAAVGLATAVASIDVEAEAAEQRRLTDRLGAAIEGIEGVTRYGPTDPALRAPHLVCVGITDVEPQAVLLGLDRRGIAAHSGSACSSEALEPSPVLEAMGVDAHRSLRLSVGWNTTDQDVDAAAEALPQILAELRALRG